MHLKYGAIINLVIGIICFWQGLDYWAALICLAIYVAWELYQKLIKKGKNTFKEQVLDIAYGIASGFIIFPVLNMLFN
jgi:hypothetical protein